MRSSCGVLHLPDVIPEEVLLDLVVIIDDSHGLEVAGEVTDLHGPFVQQLLGTHSVLSHPLAIEASGVTAKTIGICLVNWHLGKGVDHIRLLCQSGQWSRFGIQSLDLLDLREAQ